jgi:hypothetical protein
VGINHRHDLTSAELHTDSHLAQCECLTVVLRRDKDHWEQVPGRQVGNNDNHPTSLCALDLSMNNLTDKWAEYKV